MGLIEKYGMPQEWNTDDKYGPERYIEVHVWSDGTIQQYICEKRLKMPESKYSDVNNGKWHYKDRDNA